MKKLSFLRRIKIVRMLLFSLITSFFVHSSSLLPTVWAEEQAPDVMYDFGVFAYEEGKYEEALKYFEKALQAKPENPYCLHMIGKSYHMLERYDEALRFMENALKINKNIADIKHDLAQVHFKRNNYAEAARLFIEAAKEDTSDILAHYQAGIVLFKMDRFKEAIDYLTVASDKSPTFEQNAIYYIGICNYRLGRMDRAFDAFEYLSKTAESLLIKNNSQVWLNAVKARGKTEKPYSLFCKISRQYDDNVRLESVDEDSGIDAEDWSTIGILSAQYGLTINRLIAGAGYHHYQIWYDDLDAYNLMAGVVDLSVGYDLKPFYVGFSWFPSMYYVDSEKFLDRHRLNPMLAWSITDNLTAGLFYAYIDNNYRQDEYDPKDGQAQEIGFSISEKFAQKKGRIFVSAIYEDNSADSDFEDFRRLRFTAGITAIIPFSTIVDFQFEYADKKYDESDPQYGISRNDDRFRAGISLSRHLYWEWLFGGIEYEYLKNDSNVLRYDYERNSVSAFVSVKF